MKLDKKLYRERRELYQKWSDAKAVERIRETSRLSPQEAWQRYVALWEFCMKLSPTQSDLLRKKRLDEWERYYDDLQKFEEGRRKHGKAA